MHIRNYANQLLNRRNWRASRSQPAYASFCCSLLRLRSAANPSPLPPPPPSPCPPNKTFAPRLFGEEIAGTGQVATTKRNENRENWRRSSFPPFPTLSLSRSLSFNRGERDAGARCDAWDVKSSKRSPGISCGQRFLRGSVIEDG